MSLEFSARARGSSWLKLGVCVGAGLAFAAHLHAATVVEGDDQVVASRGGVSVTLAEVDARVMELPPNLRAEYLSDPVRMEDTVGAMLMEKQLAAKAFELGVDKDPYLGIKLEQAKTRFLASRARTLNEEQLEIPDFSALAEEAYLANPEKYSTPEVLDLTHVLVNEQGRSAADAKARAEEVRRLATADNADFGVLVAEYTDEHTDGKKSDGKLNQVTRGMMVPEFDAAAFALKQPGDISEVVKTRFGYHVIRLESRTAAARKPFESVKAKIVEELQTKYVTANKSNLTDTLRGMKIEANPDVVASLRDRYTPDGPKGKRVAQRVAVESGAKTR